jgi:FSR family fosmidomycin resistance protein-like MFS transporter
MLNSENNSQRRGIPSDLRFFPSMDEMNQPTDQRNSPQQKKPWKALFSFCAFHFLDDGFTDSIYLLLPFIATELGLSFGQVGFLKGIFYGSMGLFQFPLSLLGEKMGELVVLFLGGIGLTGGFLLLSLAHTYGTTLLCLVFSKGTGGGQHGLSSSILSRAFEVSGRRAAMGTYNFSGDLGKVCIPFLLTFLIGFWGWRKAVFLLSLFGGAAVVLLYGMTARNKVISSTPRQSERSSKGDRWGIRDRKSFGALLTIGIIDISVRSALLTFLPFLLIEKGVSSLHTGFALTLLFVGGALGKFFCGLLAEWLGVLPMVVSTELLTAVGILSFVWLPLSVIWMTLPLVGVVLNGTSSVLYATVAEISPPESRARGYGLYYAITLGSGAISPMLFGLLIDLTSLGLSMVLTALLALLTLPLSRYLSTGRGRTTAG